MTSVVTESRQEAVSAIEAKRLPAVVTVVEVQETVVVPVQFQPVPEEETSVMPPGSTSATVTVPTVGPVPELVTVML